MRPLTFEKLSNELAAAAANAMPGWWERIDSDPKWRSYSECVAMVSDRIHVCSMLALLQESLGQQL